MDLFCSTLPETTVMCRLHCILSLYKQKKIAFELSFVLFKLFVIFKWKGYANWFAPSASPLSGQVAYS